MKEIKQNITYFPLFNGDYFHLNIFENNLNLNQALNSSLNLNDSLSNAIRKTFYNYLYEGINKN